MDTGGRDGMTGLQDQSDGLMRLHEGSDRFLPTLRADLQVVAVVRQRLMAPLAPSDLGRLHLRNLFKQQFFEVFNQT